ncbi:MAG TPA: RNase H family protein, partial [Lacipirellula sp.]
PPHFLLFSEAALDRPQGGTWRFVLEQVGAAEALAASDIETAECPERLELLAVVRGLEALDQPASVTLVTKSRYVSRGLKRGLADWRANGWQWERFGRVVPVRDHDLWRRVDRALQFHQVECRLWQFDESPQAAAVELPSSEEQRELPVIRRRRSANGSLGAWSRRAAAALGDAFRPAGLAAG